MDTRTSVFRRKTTATSPVNKHYFLHSLFIINFAYNLIVFGKFDVRFVAAKSLLTMKRDTKVIQGQECLSRDEKIYIERVL